MRDENANDNIRAVTNLITCTFYATVIKTALTDLHQTMQPTSVVSSRTPPAAPTATPMVVQSASCLAGLAVAGIGTAVEQINLYELLFIHTDKFI